jgi:uncharacterized protein YbjT (DUF2867 family)
MKVLVAGDGAVAQATVTALLEAGHEVRLLSPQATETARLWPRGVEPWPADLARARSLEGAADGCEAVLQTGAVRGPWQRPAGHTGAPLGVLDETRIDVRGTGRLIAAAERAQATRFVLLSSLRHEKSAADDGHAMRKAEAAARAFRGVFVVLRASLVYAPGEGSIAALARMVRTLPVIPMVDGGRRVVQPLWHEDLGQALARAATAPEAAGRVLHVAGPETATVADVVDRLCALAGREPTRVPAPGLLATLAAEGAAILGVSLPATVAALAELDDDDVLPLSVANALASVLEVTPTPLEAGLGKLLAEAPEQTPGRPDVAIVRRRFWADIEGTSREPRALRDHFRRHARDILRLEDGPPPQRMLKTGALIAARVPLRGLVSLRIADVTPDAVTAVSVDGDPLAAVVTFRFLAVERKVRVEVQVDAQAANPVDGVLLGTVGGVLDDLDWRGAVERLVAASGGRAPSGVEQEVLTLHEDEAAQVRERAERLRVSRRRSRVPARAARARVPHAARASSAGTA